MANYFEFLNKCKSCGNPLAGAKVVDGVVQCDSCGNKYTMPKSDSKISTQLSMGMNFLDTCKFDDAYTTFQKALEVDSTEPEAYFGMALATAQVQYLKDYVNNRMQPIVYAVSDKSFLKDKNYIKALEYATSAQKQEYMAKANDIDSIRKQFYDLEKSDLKYDCFICVKVTEEDGARHTEDSHIASTLYHKLQEAGYTPFYSEEEIKGRTGADYEALILYALHNSPSMLLVCTDESYLQTPWVKNEYTRYLNMLNQEEKQRDSLTIVFTHNVIEKLPNVKGKIQGVPFNTYDALSRVIEFVDRFVQRSAPEIIRKEYNKTSYKKKTAIRQGVTKRKLTAVGQGKVTVSDKAKLNIATNLLKAGNFTSTINFANTLIAENPSNSEAYWLLFLAENNVIDRLGFIYLESGIQDFDNFEKAIASCTDVNRKREFYEALFNKVNQKCYLSDYKEFIELPDSSKGDIDELTLKMFEKALKDKDKSIFDVVIKTVTNVDLYISMNYDFAKRFEPIFAVEYYKNILKADESHHLAMYQVFRSEFDFDDEKILSYCAESQNHPIIEKRLFDFGFNKVAEKHLYKILSVKVKKNLEDCSKLFDFLLSIIPKEENALYKEQLNDFVISLIDCKQFSKASRYNDLLIDADKYNYDAYFYRCLINHKLHNPIGLVKYVDNLFSDENFIMALNLYSEKFPDCEINKFFDISQSLESIKVLKDSPSTLGVVVNTYKIDLHNVDIELKACKKEIYEFIADRAESDYRDMLKKYRCNNSKDLYKLSIDVTNDEGWKMCQNLAAAGNKYTLVNEIEEIIASQHRYAIKNQLNKLYDDAVKSYGCTSDEELYYLRKDITKDDCWGNILERAKEIGYNDMKFKVSQILNNQAECANQNIDYDKNENRILKKKLNESRFYLSTAIFSIISSVAMILTLILAMSKVDRIYDFWLMTFQNNKGALYGVGIVFLILPNVLFAYFICKAIYDRDLTILAGGAFWIILMMFICMCVGLSKYGPLYPAETATAVILLVVFAVGISGITGYLVYRKDVRQIWIK